MLIVVSPAKRLDWSERVLPDDMALSTPDFTEQALELAHIARGLSTDDLQKLMRISPKLAQLNYERFRDFSPKPKDETLRPAAFGFAGDTYAGLEAPSLDREELIWAQDHLRILSGIYGLLRPLDGIQPYRLEMGSHLENPKGRKLYDFWGAKIATALNEQARAMNTSVLVNCASQEYFGAVDPNALSLRVITPVFYEDKGGAPKIVSFFAKKARGAMARFIIQNRLSDPDALFDFDIGGYCYQPDLSEPDSPVFLRKEGG